MQAGVHVWVVSPAWVDQCVTEQRRAMVSRTGSSCAWQATHPPLQMLLLGALSSACRGSTQLAGVGAAGGVCWRQGELLAVRAHVALPHIEQRTAIPLQHLQHELPATFSTCRRGTMPFGGQAVPAARRPQPAHLGQHCQVNGGDTLCNPYPAAHGRGAACLAQLPVVALHMGRCSSVSQGVPATIGEAVLCWAYLTRQRPMRQTAPVPSCWLLLQVAQMGTLRQEVL